jgi:hypothetical protein
MKAFRHRRGRGRESLFHERGGGDICGGPQFRLLHVNRIGERTLASPALVEGKWYLRTDRPLIAIGQL